MLGWPTEAELAAELGLTPGQDPDRVASALWAAIADASSLFGFDPVLGVDDAGQYKAVLGLGVWWYEVRNRPEGLDSLNPVANPYQRRVMLNILGRGRMTVA